MLYVDGVDDAGIVPSRCWLNPVKIVTAIVEVFAAFGLVPAVSGKKIGTVHVRLRNVKAGVGEVEAAGQDK